ncbi:glycosyl transferase family protein [Candidatus Magnetobacterium bavaricum]|uniref:Glycosyl transferase family protein n=1 Tax=Candidatus Magnetobacterium bavaricum TaxID=29290 RepID=A0A0F3GSY6_9BACT|nr:glycosyl transferase family protein [Candidatus Magnetobacterium bavaricum]
MNIKQMRRIDYYAGGVICLLLQAYEGLRSVFGRRSVNQPREVRAILVTKYLGMGSILLATPMLRGLRAFYPQARIVLLTFKGNVALARLIDLIDEVDSIDTTTIFTFLWDVQRLLHKNRRQRYDIVFDLEFFARFSTIVSYLSGAGIRVGYQMPKLWRGNLLTHRIYYNPHRHVTEVFAAQLEPFGIELQDMSLSQLRGKPHTRGVVLELLRQRGLVEGETIISVNINASELSEERRWPITNFVELISYIAKNKPHTRIVLIGSARERQYVSDCIELIPEDVRGGVTDLCGVVDIEGLVGLFEMSALFITNDSGPLHIASAVGTPTVAFFGPETPTLYGPVDSASMVFYSGLYCSPCLNVYNAKTAPCKEDNVCMKEITPSDVIGRLKKEGIL